MSEQQQGSGKGLTKGKSRRKRKLAGYYKDHYFVTSRNKTKRIKAEILRLSAMPETEGRKAQIGALEKALDKRTATRMFPL